MYIKNTIVLNTVVCKFAQFILIEYSDESHFLVMHDVFH